MNRSEVPIMLCSFSKFSYQGSSTNLNCSWRNHFSIRLISTQVKPFLFNEMGWGKTIIHKELIISIPDISTDSSSDDQGQNKKDCEQDNWNQNIGVRQELGEWEGWVRLVWVESLVRLNCFCWNVKRFSFVDGSSSLIWNMKKNFYLTSAEYPV